MHCFYLNDGSHGSLRTNKIKTAIFEYLRENKIKSAIFESLRENRIKTAILADKLLDSRLCVLVNSEFVFPSNNDITLCYV